MRDVLLAMVQELSQRIDKVREVGIVASEDLPPASWQLPYVGLKDGGKRYNSQPGQMDREIGRVEVWIYQTLILNDSGAAVVGGGSTPGLLEIAQDIRAVLNDNDLGLALPYTHVDEIRASIAGIQDNARWVQRLSLAVNYERVVS